MEAIINTRCGENQFGAKVPTETEAIHNLTAGNRRSTQVARFGMPSIEKRTEAANVFNEALSAGMTKEEAVGLAMITTEIPEDFSDMIPEWARLIGARPHVEEDDGIKHRKRYTVEFKKEFVKYFYKMRDAGYGVNKAVELANEKFGIAIADNVIYRWEKRVGMSHRNYGLYGTNVNDGDADSNKTSSPNQSVAKSLATCAHCQKEIPISGFSFCPYCGKPLETEKQYVLRIGESLKDVLIKKQLDNMIFYVDMMLDLIKREVKD